MPTKSVITEYDNHYFIFNDYMYTQITKDEHVRLYYDFELKIFFTLKTCKENINIGACDVTNYVKVLLRSITLQDVILKNGEEFNIYRSYIISQEDKEKIAMSLLGLILQIALTTAIIYNFIDDVNDNGLAFYFDFNEIGNIIKILISLLIFSLISYKHKFTVEAYCHFYEWAVYYYKVPAYLKYADFISNIIIGYIISYLSFFFLATSETFSDLVLNSFALTFITEIDDMINIFETDEGILIDDDIQSFRNNLYANQISVEYKWAHFIPILGSPFGTFLSLKRLWEARHNIFRND